MIGMLLLFAAAAATPAPQCPGWLGFGFNYHPPQVRGSYPSGWMHVQGIAPASPAAKAGLERFDVITEIDGQPLLYATDLPLLQRLSRVVPGQSLRLTVIRGTAKRVRVITAQPSPPERCRVWRENLDMARGKK